jgi:hypothetical protein
LFDDGLLSTEYLEPGLSQDLFWAYASEHDALKQIAERQFVPSSPLTNAERATLLELDTAIEQTKSMAWKARESGDPNAAALFKQCEEQKRSHWDLVAEMEDQHGIHEDFVRFQEANARDYRCIIARALQSFDANKYSLENLLKWGVIKEGDF